MDCNKKDKQKYLVQQIIDKGFEPEDFQQFMIKQKQNAEDLDDWNFQELIVVVKQFQQNASKEILFKQKINRQSKDNTFLQNNNQIKQNSLHKNQDNNQKILQNNSFLEFNSDGKYEVFSQTINCITTIPSFLLKLDVSVKIQKVDKKQGGIFQQSYIAYCIYTAGINKQVERRYSDFEWLRNILKYLHPGYPIPAIASKGKFRRYDQNHIRKRKIILQMFLNKLLTIPELKADQIVEKFLSITDQTQFQRFKSAHNWTKSSVLPIDKIKNLKGRVNIVLDPSINKFLSESEKYLREMEPEIKIMQKQFKTVASSFESGANSLNGISKNCEILSNKDEVFRNEVQLNHCKTNFYSIIQKVAQKLSCEMNKMSQILRNQLYSLLKYDSLYMMGILEYFQTLGMHQSHYNQMKNNLLKKKTKLYEEGNMIKWGLSTIPQEKPNKADAIKAMLPTQTEQLGKYRQVYALHNFQLFEELNRQFTNKNINTAPYLENIAKLETTITSELMMLWVDTQTEIMGMKQNKQIRLSY